MDQKFAVLPFALRVSQKAHKGYNLPALEAGTTVYGIRHIESGDLFSYAYTRFDTAAAVCAKLCAEYADSDEGFSYPRALNLVRLLGFNFSPIARVRPVVALTPDDLHSRRTSRRSVAD